MSIKKFIPNLITLINLFCGCIALLFVFQEKFYLAFIFVALGIFFDFFDGFFARLFHASSELGLQLDSLADMITSGIVPGAIMFKLLTNALHVSEPFVLTDVNFWIATLGFIVTMGSCYRLANFNIDTRQTDSFIGLPTPANALFILSLPIVLKETSSIILLELLISPEFLLFICFLSAYILNAEIPLFSLKIKNFSFKKYALQIIFVSFSLVLIVLLQFAAVPIIIITYVLISIITNKLSAKKI
jgi:CDP-diacylglycerol--serine O-phosphatidyltransferase